MLIEIGSNLAGCLNTLAFGIAIGISLYGLTLVIRALTAPLNDNWKK
jgi:tetrahydromethanopterin S-methyltransferase subunit B